jgi:hypothetical protein
VTCGFPEKYLALHVEADLPLDEAFITEKHLAICEDCRQFVVQLAARQSSIKSLRQDAIHAAAYAGLRQCAMSRIRCSLENIGWMLRIERALFMAFRGRGYALAGLVLAAVVSVSLIAQITHSRAAVSATAGLQGNVLLRPHDYRQWVLAGTGEDMENAHSVDASESRASHKVYITPAAYRAYLKNGIFPEGTIMVLEQASGAAGTELMASVKDSRFEGGWGFFDFGRGDGQAKESAPEAGCRTCHDERAQTDHVFTQYYPALRPARAES